MKVGVDPYPAALATSISDNAIRHRLQLRLLSGRLTEEVDRGSESSYESRSTDSNDIEIVWAFLGGSSRPIDLRDTDAVRNNQ
jgi:hypothetical protein